MTRYLALFGVFAALWLPAGALALGLGEIRLNSALNQPLDAEIELIAPSAQELSVLKAEVAKRETFDRYGLDRPDFLSTFRFSVGRSADGSPVLKVMSTRPVTEPFVTFLVEADWEKGRLLREYTVLLDPPAFMPEEQDQAAQAVTAPRPSTSPSRPLSGNVVRPDSQPQPAPSRPASRPRSLDPEPTGGVYGPVQRNENLWNIASRYRDDSVTMNQMMLAIYEANPQAFANNINHLKQGATLRIPDLDAARRISRSQALATAKTHNDAWQSGRGQVASTGTAPSPGDGPAPGGRDSGRLELVSPRDETGQTGQSSRQLQAMQQELDAQQARANRAEENLTTARSELEEARRLIDVQDDRLAEMQSRLADAGEEVPEAPVPEPVTTDAGVDMTPAAGDDASPEMADASEAVDAEPVAEPDATEGEPEPTEPVAAAPTPATVVPAAAEEPGLFDTLKGLWLWLLLGLAAIGGGIAFALSKRKQEEPAAADEIDEVTDEVDAGATVLHERSNTEPVQMPEPEESVKYFEDTGTFKPVDFVPDENEDKVDAGPDLAIVPRPETAESGEYPFDDTMDSDPALNLDQSDPLAEADFHMAYGLYDQAAELVGKAVEREPARRDLQLKLLEIFFVWGNKESFLESAQRLFDTQEDAPPGEWDKILIMGKQICPDAALFSGEASASVGSADSVDLELTSVGSIETLDFETSDEAAGVDLDLGEALSAEPDSSDDDVLDFDFGDEEPSELEQAREKIEDSVLDTEDTAEMDVDEIGLDLDIGETLPEPEEDGSGATTISSDAEELQVGTGIFDDFDILGASDDKAPEASDASDTSETAEVRASAETSEFELPDGDFDFDFDDLDDADGGAEDTARDLAAVDEPTAADDSEEGEFSGEIQTLSDDAIDLDLGDLIDEQTGETVAAKVLPANFTPEAMPDAAEDTIGPEDETVQTPVMDADAGDDFSDVFGMGDETVKADISELNLGNDEDDAFAAVFDADDATVKADISELNVGDAIPGFDDDTVNADISELGDPGEMGGLDFDLGGESENDTDVTRELKTPGAAEAAVDLDVGDAQTGADEAPTTMTVPAAELALPDGGDNELNEVGTKLDLARAYVDMGDPDGARGILEEVIDEGDEKQQRDARELLESLA